MFLEMYGPDWMMDGLRLALEDQLTKAGYAEGPKISSMDSGVMLNFSKDGTIISVQVTEETDANQCYLRIESEVEVPELYELWDGALIQYGKEVLGHLYSFAINKEKVTQGIK